MQDGGKIQNGGQNTKKNLILLPNGQFSTNFKKLLCVLFVVLASTNIR
jgi:hypothetical protein